MPHGVKCVFGNSTLTAMGVLVDVIVQLPHGYITWKEEIWIKNEGRKKGEREGGRGRERERERERERMNEWMNERMSE